MTKDELIEYTISKSVRFPDKARLAVESIIADLCNRGGLKYEWYEIDADIRYEIADTWTAIITKIYSEDFDMTELLKRVAANIDKPISEK